MPAKELGIKHVCFKCGAKFYDMKKPDPVCPKCGTNQRDSPALKPAGEPRRGRLAAVPKVIEPTPEEPEAVVAEEEEEEAESFEDDDAELPADED